jgi:hypothetical protein
MNSNNLIFAMRPSNTLQKFQLKVLHKLEINQMKLAKLF